MIEPERVEAGQAVYSPMVLRTYDAIVLGFSNRFLWRCPTKYLRRLYQRNVSARHLDVGVGTGYFLDKVEWPVAIPDIMLLDLNSNCLATASRRLRRFAPKAALANVLAPLPPLGTFQSAGLCYLLHCLPGTMPEKAVVFDHLKPQLAAGARVFGATIVQGRAPRSKPARALMNLYNSKGIFSNADDAAEALDFALRARYRDVKLWLIGTVALFEARA
jgi:hypothetical protein